MCAKELFVQRFDPITVSYAVLSGMQTFSPLLRKRVQALTWHISVVVQLSVSYTET